MNNYLYFWGTFPVFCFAIVLIYRISDPRIRTNLLRRAITTGILGILSEYFFFKDYWLPPIIIKFWIFGGIEDFFFGFSMPVLMYTIANALSILDHDYSEMKSNIYLFSKILHLLPIILLPTYLDINSIYASMFSFLLPAFAYALYTKRNIMKALALGSISGLLLVILEGIVLGLNPTYLSQYFLYYNNSPVLLGRFPLTEFLWGFSYGFYFQTLVPINLSHQLPLLGYLQAFLPKFHRSSSIPQRKEHYVSL